MKNSLYAAVLFAFAISPAAHAQTSLPPIGGQPPGPEPSMQAVAEYTCSRGTDCKIACRADSWTETFDAGAGAVVYKSENSDHLWLTVGIPYQILLGDSTVCDFSALDLVPPSPPPARQPTPYPIPQLPPSSFQGHPVTPPGHN